MHIFLAIAQCIIITKSNEVVCSKNKALNNCASKYIDYLESDIRFLDNNRFDIANYTSEKTSICTKCFRKLKNRLHTLNVTAIGLLSPQKNKKSKKYYLPLINNKMYMYVGEYNSKGKRKSLPVFIGNNGPCTLDVNVNKGESTIKTTTLDLIWNSKKDFAVKNFKNKNKYKSCEFVEIINKYNKNSILLLFKREIIWYLPPFPEFMTVSFAYFLSIYKYAKIDWKDYEKSTVLKNISFLYNRGFYRKLINLYEKRYSQLQVQLCQLSPVFKVKKDGFDTNTYKTEDLIDTILKKFNINAEDEAVESSEVDGEDLRNLFEMSEEMEEAEKSTKKHSITNKNDAAIQEIKDHMDQTKNENTSHINKIILIILGSVFGFCLIVGAIVFYRTKYKK